jgi:hypothetical protein
MGSPANPAVSLCILNAQTVSINMHLWVYGRFGVPVLKTTVEMPDDLYRQAKAVAALRGRKFKELVEEGLRLVIAAPRESRRRPGLRTLMRRAHGMVDSGISDLGSNPSHLSGFGRNAGHR